MNIRQQLKILLVSLSFCPIGSSLFAKGTNAVINTAVSEYRESEKKHIKALKKATLNKWKKLINDLTRLENELAGQKNYIDAQRVKEKIAKLRAERRYFGYSIYPSNLITNVIAKAQSGDIFIVKVTGKSKGAIYGANPYTYDSNINVAAVHSGAVKNNQTAYIKVTFLYADQFISASKNGIKSIKWAGKYRAIQIDSNKD